MFIDKEDYRVVIGDQAFKVVSQAEPGVVAGAELQAIEEMAGYLRPVYDTDAVFNAVGSDRNPLLVMYAADIALYHMSASMPQKMGSEIRKERYDRAIKWLEGVQSGKIVPSLPLTQDNCSTSSFGTVYHSDPPIRHNW